MGFTKVYGGGNLYVIWLLWPQTALIKALALYNLPTPIPFSLYYTKQLCFPFLIGLGLAFALSKSCEQVTT